MLTPFEKIRQSLVVPVISIDREADALPLADALLEGGLPVAEITFRTSAAAAVIHRMAAARPELTVGAGTVLDGASLQAAYTAGAQFGVAPGFDPEIVDAASIMGLPFVPGGMTPGDIGAAVRRGVRLIKFFPAQAAGGPKMLEAIAAPFAHLGVRFIPTGGVSERSMGDWLAVPGVMAVGGTWIARAEDIREHRWAEIAHKARAAVTEARRHRETGS